MSLTREQVAARFCRLQSEVARRHVGFGDANDCFCGVTEEGGLEASHYERGYFRSDGTALAFIERVVRERLDELETADV